MTNHERIAFIEDAIEASAQEDEVREALARAAYLAILPVRTLSRSPLTGDLISIPFDDAGLDGLWWDAYRPVRPEPTMGLPDGVLSFAGAMELRPPFANVPFLVSPGPGVPFVDPALLGRDGVVAVLSSVNVGAHTGYAIAYFADRPPADAPMLDWWGARFHRYRVGTSVVAGSRPGFEGDWDFDLSGWVRQEKLQWIAPGDQTFELRRGTHRCPYLELPGERTIARIEDGEMWRSTPGYS